MKWPFKKKEPVWEYGNYQYIHIHRPCSSRFYGDPEDPCRFCGLPLLDEDWEKVVARPFYQVLAPYKKVFRGYQLKVEVLE